MIKKIINILKKLDNLTIVKNNNNNKSNNVNTNVNNNTPPKPIKYINFNVAGVTFDDIQEKIKKLVNKEFRLGNAERYGGETLAELKKYDGIYYEAEDVSFDIVEFILTKYENEDAIEVHIGSEKNNLVNVGYVPKNKIVEIKDYIKFKKENPHYKYFEEIYVEGGKARNIDFGECEEIIYNYGINIRIEVFIK